MKMILIVLSSILCLTVTAQKNKNNRAAAKDSIGKIKEIRNPFDSNKIKQPANAGTQTNRKAKKTTNNNQALPAASGTKQQNGYANQEVNYANGGESKPEMVATSHPEKPGEIKTLPKDKPEPVKAKEPVDNSPQKITRGVGHANPNSEVVIQLEPNERGWYKNIQLVCTGGGAINFVKVMLMLEDGNPKTININELVTEGHITASYATGLINEKLYASGDTKKNSYKLEKVVSVRITLRSEPGMTTSPTQVGMQCILWK
ncbi:MAG: hypothetical protein JNM19_18445 [Chitinophagaceae bacterium]|nr:hypothetical protein [Chitinophagaceae bacterium]